MSGFVTLRSLTGCQKCLTFAPYNNRQIHGIGGVRVEHMNAQRATAGFVAPGVLERIRVGREYVSAKYGFRNHWYPALFSNELHEGQVVPIELLGEKILLKR